MQIKAVKIAGFGQFEHVNWIFNPGVQIVYGANETGKSTIRQFILGVLFGYPTRRHPAERYEPKQSQQYGGSLIVTNQGNDYQIDRDIENQVRVTNLSTGQVGGSQLLTDLLAGIDLDLYRQIFTFNQAELRQISSLKPVDLNTQLQQIGASGSREWIAVQNSAIKAADQLYKPKARVLPLNIELKKYQQLQMQLTAAGDSYQKYQELDLQQQQNLAAIQANRHNLQQCQDENNRLSEIARRWSDYQQYRDLSQAEQVVDQISPVNAKQFQQLTTQAQQLQASLQDTQQQLNGQATNTTENNQSEFYWQNQLQFDQLFQQLPAEQRVLGQLIEQKQNLQQLQTIDSQTLAANPVLEKLMAAPAEQVQQWSQDIMQTQTRSQSQKTTQLSPLVWVGGGAVIVGLMLPTFFFKLLFVLIGLIVGWWGYQNVHQPDNQQQPLLIKWARFWQLNEVQATLTGQQQLVHDWQNFQTNHEQIQAIQQQIEQTQKNLTEYLRGYQFAQQWIPIDFQQLEMSFQRLETFRDQIQQNVDQKNGHVAQLQVLQKLLQQQKAKIQVNLEQQQQLFEQTDVADAEDFRNRLAQQANMATNQQQAARLKASFSAAEFQQFGQYSDYQAVTRAKHDRARQLSTLQATEQQLTMTKTALTQQMTQLTSDSSYDNLQQQVTNQAAKVSQIAQQWLTEKLAAEWVQSALTKASSARLPRINLQANSYFSLLTEQRYNKIDFDAEQLRVLRTTDQQSFTVAELSTATAEQLYLALRLAVIAVLDLSLPIIIDDGLVNFDPQREHAAWELLAQISHQHQVLYFTTETIAVTEFPTAKSLNLSNGGTQ